MIGNSDGYIDIMFELKNAQTDFAFEATKCHLSAIIALKEAQNNLEDENCNYILGSTNRISMHEPAIIY